MWAITGMMVIPGDPQLKISAPSNSSKGQFFNFKAVTQGRNVGDNAQWQHWDVAMWVPDDKVDMWKEDIKPSHVFLVEHSYVTSYPVQDGKYHNTKIRLEQSKVKRLHTPMWVKK